MKYRREIDGLRALAVIPVILFHTGSKLLTGGYLGVDIFFVISGYLISSIILSDLTKGIFSFKKFYERRARRILPALSLVTILCLPFAWFWMTPIQFEEFSNSLVATSLFVSNILFWKESGYFDDPSEIKPLMHTWSLSIEEQFYIFFPIALLFLWKLSKNRLILIFGAVALLSVIGAEIASEDYVEFNFYLLPSRIWELLVGVIIALLQQKYSKQLPDLKVFKLMPLIGLGMILVPMFVFHEHTDHPGLLTLIPVGGTALIIFFGGKNDLVSRILSTRLLVGIGLISYSLYLWHQPLFAFARIASINKLTASNYIYLTALTFILAFISWKFVEQPFRNKEKIPANYVWRFTATSLVFFISFGAVGSIYNGVPARFEKPLLTIANYKKLNANKIFFQDGEKCFGREVAKACVIGAQEFAPSYALVGDSHAGILAMQLDKELKKYNKSGIELAHAGCPYTPGFTMKGSDACNEINNSYRDRIMKDDISTVIISGRYVIQLERETFDNKEGGKEKGKKIGYVPADDPDIKEPERRQRVAIGYKKAIQDLLDKGKKIVLIYPIPEVGWHVPRTLFKYKVTKGEDKLISTSYDRYLERSKNVISIFNSIKSNPNLVRVYPDKIFCNSFIKGRCVANYEDKVFYSDDDHLSLEGVKLLMQEVSRATKEKWKSAF